jgi:hypothetical protein
LLEAAKIGTLKIATTLHSNKLARAAAAEAFASTRSFLLQICFCTARKTLHAFTSITELVMFMSAFHTAKITVDFLETTLQISSFAIVSCHFGFRATTLRHDLF